MENRTTHTSGTAEFKFEVITPHDKLDDIIEAQDHPEDYFWVGQSTNRLDAVAESVGVGSMQSFAYEVQKFMGELVKQEKYRFINIETDLEIEGGEWGITQETV